MKKQIKSFRISILVFGTLLLLLNGCRQEIEITPPDEEKIALPEYISIEGFYLLNEGNMGSNKATLDYYDYQTGVYTRNIFNTANPTAIKELGDVGNDLECYGNKLYAVINGSNKIEVMEASTAKSLGQIDIPNCRYIAFDKGYAYVTSYAGPVQIDPDYKQLGYVAKIDTATLQVVNTCVVGYQPEELEIVGGKLYVANSGGYMSPNYENTISVVDINTFEEIKRIKVAVNLHRLCVDKNAYLWVSSRGDYFGKESCLYYIDTKTDHLIDSIEIAVSNFYLDGDSLYLCSTEWSNANMNNEITFGIVDITKRTVVSTNFITDGTDKNLKRPYGILVNPITKDIYITDAGNYVTPGKLYCFDKNGQKKWDVYTGDIPAHFAFKGVLKQ